MPPSSAALLRCFQMNKEDPKLLAEWFEYNTDSPSCLKWKKQPPYRRVSNPFITYCSKYYQVKLFGNWYPCHRIILILHGFLPAENQVADHINRNMQDNRIENLRWVSRSQNNSNRIVCATSGIKYVRAAPSGRFRADYTCPLSSKKVYCGTYDNALEAHLAAITHKLEHSWCP